MKTEHGARTTGSFAMGLIPVEPVSFGLPVIERERGSVARASMAAVSSERSGAERSGGGADTDGLPAAEAVAQFAPSEQAPKIDPAVLIARGNEFMALSDVVSARLLYKRATDGGSAAGAVAMGATYDPLEIDRLNLRGIRPDPGKALEWYRKAADLGDSASVARTERLMALLRREAARGDPGAQALLRASPQ